MENWRQYLDEETTDSSQNQEIMIEIHKLIKNQCTILTEDARGTLYFESVQRGLEKLVSRYGKKALSAAVAATLGLASPVATMKGSSLARSVEVMRRRRFMIRRLSDGCGRRGPPASVHGAWRAAQTHAGRRWR